MLTLSLGVRQWCLTWLYKEFEFLTSCVNKIRKVLLFLWLWSVKKQKLHSTLLSTPSDCDLIFSISTQPQSSNLVMKHNYPLAIITSLSVQPCTITQPIKMQWTLKWLRISLFNGSLPTLFIWKLSISFKYSPHYFIKMIFNRVLGESFRAIHYRIVTHWNIIKIEQAIMKIYF